MDLGSSLTLYPSAIAANAKFHFESGKYLLLRADVFSAVLLLAILAMIVVMTNKRAGDYLVWLGGKAGYDLHGLASSQELMTPGAVNVSDAKVGLNSWAAGGGSAGAEGADTQFLSQRTPTLSGNVAAPAGDSCPAGWTAGARDELAALSTVGTYTDAELHAALGGR